MSSRSNPPPLALERYLREEDRHRAFLGQQNASSPYISQVSSHFPGFYGPQAPPYRTTSDPYQASSRSHGGSNGQVSAIPEYPHPDDGWPLPEYPNQYQDPAPSHYRNAPRPTHYPHSQSSEAPPPYDGRSVRQSTDPYETLDDPIRPPPYEVSMRSQETIQSTYDWDREWQRTEQTRDDDSSCINDRRHRHVEFTRRDYERRSNDGERRRRMH